MMTLGQAALLGLLQGATELFPISSLGHSVLLPQVLGWQIDQGSDAFLTFLVATHLATALVLFGFFWKDWMRIIVGVLRSLKDRHVSADDIYTKIGWLLIVGTIPAGILGLSFEHALKQLFAAASVVAGALILNGVVLYAAESLRARAPEGLADDKKIANLSWRQAIFVGIMQCGALIPGLSRTGLTMTGGLLSGLSHENAARFSFLLATPIIFAASMLKTPHLIVDGGQDLQPALVGALCAAVTAYLSVKFLLKYFETKTLKPFAIYCIITGVVSLLVVH